MTLLGPVTFLEGDSGSGVVRGSLALARGASLGLGVPGAGRPMAPPACAQRPSDHVSVILMVCGEEEMCFILESHPAVIKVTSSLLATKDSPPLCSPVRQASWIKLLFPVLYMHDHIWAARSQPALNNNHLPFQSLLIVSNSL